jgi:large subunit ribosomal protein L14e
MMEIGRLCVKIAGRDSKKTCVIVDILENNYVLVDGETRRKKCNIKHLEPLNKKLNIKKGSDFKEITKLFKELGIELKEKNSKEAKERPIRKRKVKESLEEPKKKTKVKKEK